MTSAWTRETPIGVLTLTEEAGALTGVLFGPDAPEGALRMETPLIRRAFAQLEEQAFAGVSEAEREQFLAVFRRVYGNLKEGER